MRKMAIYEAKRTFSEQGVTFTQKVAEEALSDVFLTRREKVNTGLKDALYY